jgi:hypothetical protein
MEQQGLPQLAAELQGVHGRQQQDLHARLCMEQQGRPPQRRFDACQQQGQPQQPAHQYGVNAP